jgi:hypothetical protein
MRISFPVTRGQVRAFFLSSFRFGSWRDASVSSELLFDLAVSLLDLDRIIYKE